MTQLAWSYSALNSFETCPKRHYLTKVAKTVREPDTEALRWGNSVHKALEDRVRHGTPLPTGMTQWESLIQRLERTPGELMAERQLALNAAFKPVDWFAKDVWVRGIVDVGVVADDKVLALDYKTGKPKPDSDQLALFAALLLHYHPQADKVVTGFVWLKDKTITQQTYTRDQLTELWNTFLPRVKRLENAKANNHWPAKPSGLCRNWCPCTGCEHNGRRT